MDIQPSGAKCRLEYVLLSSLVRLAVLVLPIATTGCLCLSFGGHEHRDSDGPFTQGGKVVVQQGQEMDVYYAVPFASPPNLEIHDQLNVHVIVDQQADHFRLRNNAHFVQVSNWPGVEWTARGMHATNVVAAPPTPTAVPARLSSPTATQVSASADQSGH